MDQYASKKRNSLEPFDKYHGALSTSKAFEGFSGAMDNKHQAYHDQEPPARKAPPKSQSTGGKNFQHALAEAPQSRPGVDLKAQYASQQPAANFRADFNSVH